MRRVRSRRRARSSWLGPLEQLGPLDIVVNSAGINVARRRMCELDPADFDRIMAVNCTGFYNVLHAVLPGMRERARRADRQHLVDRRQAGAAAGRAGLLCLEVRGHRPGDRGRTGRTAQRHSHHQHLPGRGRYSATRSATGAGARRKRAQMVHPGRHRAVCRRPCQAAAERHRAGTGHYAALSGIFLRTYGHTSHTSHRSRIGHPDGCRLLAGDVPPSSSISMTRAMSSRTTSFCKA